MLRTRNFESAKVRKLATNAGAPAFSSLEATQRYVKRFLLCQMARHHHQHPKIALLQQRDGYVTKEELGEHAHMV